MEVAILLLIIIEFACTVFCFGKLGQEIKHISESTKMSQLRYDSSITSLNLRINYCEKELSELREIVEKLQGED